MFVSSGNADGYYKVFVIEQVYEYHISKFVGVGKAVHSKNLGLKYVVKLMKYRKQMKWTLRD